MRLYGYLLMALVAALLAPMALLMGNKLLFAIFVISFIAAVIKTILYNPMDDIE